jgi:hypothetical protein
MKKTRNSVFETNSSSTHSISISESNAADLIGTFPIDEDGNIHLLGGDFGWEQASYNDPETKANYALVYAADWSGDRSEEFQQTLKDVIQEQTGCNEVFFVGSGTNYKDEPDYGYIDHQSVEDRDLHYLFEDKEQLRQFIFNTQSILFTDNDNH